MLGREITSRISQCTALNGKRSALRALCNGGKSITLEITEFDGTPENNIPGGPGNAPVVARLVMESDIVKAAEWLSINLEKWLVDNR